MKKKIWNNIHFGRVMVWCNVSLHSAKYPFFYSSVTSNHPGAKSVVRQGIEPILFPKQQRRPLPSLLYKSFLVYTEETVLRWFCNNV